MPSHTFALLGLLEEKSPRTFAKLNGNKSSNRSYELMGLRFWKQSSVCSQPKTGYFPYKLDKHRDPIEANPTHPSFFIHTSNSNAPPNVLRLGNNPQPAAHKQLIGVLRLQPPYGKALSNPYRMDGLDEVSSWHT
jgi:hypothetical protein